MRKAVRSILRFIIRHKRLDAFFSKYDWFKKLVYEEAQAVIGNRPDYYCPFHSYSSYSSRKRDTTEEE